MSKSFLTFVSNCFFHCIVPASLVWLSYPPPSWRPCVCMSNRLFLCLLLWDCDLTTGCKQKVWALWKALLKDHHWIFQEAWISRGIPRWRRDHGESAGKALLQACCLDICNHEDKSRESTRKICFCYQYSLHHNPWAGSKKKFTIPWKNEVSVFFTHSLKARWVDADGLVM